MKDTETTDITPGAYQLAHVLSSMRMRAILHDRDRVLLGNPLDQIHSCWISPDVYDHYDLGPWRDPPFNVLRIRTERIEINVAEYATRPATADCRCRCVEGVTR